MHSDVIAIIPARSGSKGFPDKNIKALAGFPLLAYSIIAAKLSGIGRIILSTDSSNYAEIGKKYGAETPFLRPEEISLDHSTDFEFMYHAMNWIKEKEGFLPEYWLHLRPTSPLRDHSMIIKALEELENSNNASSLRSAHVASESPFKWFLKDKNNLFEPIVGELTPEQVNNPRQEFPEVFVPNGYVDIVRSSFVLKKKALHGQSMLVFETDNIIEIDESLDFERLEFEVNRSGHPLINSLNELENE